MSPKNHKQKFIIGGLIAALGLGFVAFKQMRGQDTKQNQQIQAASIDRVTIIKIMKELKKELFTVFQNFSAVSQNIKQQSMGRARPEEIKMMLLEQPMFRGEIDAVEDAVYQSFGVNKGDWVSCGLAILSTLIQICLLHMGNGVVFDLISIQQNSFQYIYLKQNLNLPFNGNILTMSVQVISLVDKGILIKWVLVFT